MEWDVLIGSVARPEWDAATDAERVAATSSAVAILHSLTGQSVGVTTRTVRPLPDVERPSTYRGSGGVLIAPGIVIDADCSHTSRVITLDGPVVNIVAVRIDGDPLPAEAYRVDNQTHLIRTDGQPWPVQDLSVPDDAAGSLLVVYKHGVPANADAQLAAGTLAVEVLRGAAGDGACRLPPNVINVNRQGVNIEIDPAAYLEAGLTGVPYVDQWVRQVNPSGLRTQPTIVIPERRRSRR